MRIRIVPYVFVLGTPSNAFPGKVLVIGFVRASPELMLPTSGSGLVHN